MKSWKNSVIRWLRILHRDIGYLMVGISLVYGISGIYLNHLKPERDPAYKSTFVKLELPAGLDEAGITAAWNARGGLPEIKNIMPIDERMSRLLIDGGIGVYDSGSGTLDYELHKKKPVVYWINKLHYNKVKGWKLMGDIFAVSLIFFAVSGLLMVPGKKGLAGRGKWFLLVGLIIPILYVIFS